MADRESDRPELALPPDSPLIAHVGPAWGIIPLRVPGGWTVHHNALDARLLDSGLVEVNDSEDLVWMQRARPPWLDAAKTWRDVALDVGWYRRLFRVVLLDPDWDNVAAAHETTDLDELVEVIERWLLKPPIVE
ncbi:hypothetical protein AB0I28_24515 [Phytomonospora sp. NPDC050363]|uniref:hypothetical protein n=1 Tax=Phytomonospora sp. NPDC050363 TaxID=3155642 RepID=UPI0033EE9B81